MSDTGGNTVYKITATGLSPNMTFVDMGNEFGSVDLSTGVVTPIFTGVSPHGLVFVPTPEPATLTLIGGGFVGILARRLKKRCNNLTPTRYAGLTVRSV